MAEAETVAESAGARKRSRTRRPAAPVEAFPQGVDTPDPIELAMKAVASGADQHPAVRAVLERHAQLIEIQCRREAEELALLRLQRMTRFAWLTAGLAVLLSVGALLWVAANSNSLVVEPFEVPPALAQRGLNGKVVSARVLDRLAELQRATESMRGEKSYANAWSDDIKLDIPQTGVSISEAWRTIKGWLGNETRIAGEVVQTPTGIAITTRSGGLSGGTTSGTEAEIDRLVTEAARGIYRVTQPYRYATSLSEAEKAESSRILQELARDPLPGERKWALSGLSVTARLGGDDQRAREMALRALEVDPKLLPAIGNLGLAELNLGHDERFLAVLDRWVAAQDAARSGEYDPRIVEMNSVYQDASAATVRRDAPALRRAAAAFEPLVASGAFQAAALRVAAAYLVHDPRRAAEEFRALRDQPGVTPVQIVEVGRTARLSRALELRDADAMRAALAELQAARAQVPAELLPQWERANYPDAAIALASLGFAREAAALAAPLPGDCYSCVRAKGWAALAAGNRAGARRHFEEAVRQGPSLAPAKLDLARLLAAEGKHQQAAGLFGDAARRAPNWADPPRYWGDALARAGDLAGAIGKYRQALALAPRWGGLRIAYGKALWNSGDRAGARREFETADRLPIGKRMRAELAPLLARARTT